MGRPRLYERQQVVDRAKQVFWDRGYEGTAVADLEDATGLSRSSLYLAFGKKKALFDAALTEYLETFVEQRLGPVEAPGAELREAAGFFKGLAALYRGAGSQRGCLMINSIAELAGVDPAWKALGAKFADRYRAAFLNALRNAEAHGAMSHRQATNRAEVLTAGAIGVWLAVRVDRLAAVATCRALASEITSWGAAGAG